MEITTVSLTCPRPLQRSEAVAVARSWIGTPYVLRGRIKGDGCDCATLLAEYLIECGFSEREDLGVYSHDWFCHAEDERYMLRLLRHAPRTLARFTGGKIGVKDGSLALFKVAGSRLFNHGGIVTEWPRMVHATPNGVKENNVRMHCMTAAAEVAFFDPWGETN